MVPLERIAAPVGRVAMGSVPKTEVNGECPRRNPPVVKPVSAPPAESSRIEIALGSELDFPTWPLTVRMTRRRLSTDTPVAMPALAESEGDPAP